MSLNEVIEQNLFSPEIIQGHADYCRGQRNNWTRYAHNVYTNKEYKIRAAGGKVDNSWFMQQRLKMARNHLLWLKSHGIGVWRISNVTGISSPAVHEIVSGKTKRIYKTTFDKIMAIGLHMFEPCSNKNRSGVKAEYRKIQYSVVGGKRRYKRI